MDIDPRTPTDKNPPEQFTGDVWLDPIASPREAGQRMFVGTVRFAPGPAPPGTPTPSARRCTSPRASRGCSRAAARRSRPPPARRLLPPGRGALARRRPGLLHGAPGDARQRRRPAATTTWLEHVTDADYQPDDRRRWASHRLATNARMSAASRSGSSIAMKWPPRGRTVQRGSWNCRRARDSGGTPPISASLRVQRDGGGVGRQQGTRAGRQVVRVVVQHGRAERVRGPVQRQQREQDLPRRGSREVQGAPCVPLLDDPTQDRQRRVGDREGDGQRLGALKLVVGPIRG